MSRSFDRKQEAEAWASEVERDMRRGRHVDLRAAGTLTIRDALKRYESEVSVHKRSYKNECKTIRLFLASNIADRTLVNLGAADIAKWRDARLKGGLAATLNDRFCLWFTRQLSRPCHVGTG